MNKSVFKFFNGVEDVFGDPIRLQRRLTQALAGKPNDVLAEAGSSDPIIAAGAEDKLYTAARFAFDLPPFDVKTGVGATDADCDNAVNALIGYLESVKSAGEK